MHFVDYPRFGRRWPAGKAGYRPYRAYTLLWRWLISHAGVLQHVCPLSACASMTVFQMLAKVVCTEELFGLITLSELVHMIQVL